MLIFLECLSKFCHIPSYIFPSPLVVLKTLFLYKKSLLLNASITFLEAILGILLAIILTLVLGSLFFYFRWFYLSFSPFILLFQMIPLVAIAPIIILWFGFGFFPKILLVSLFAVFPMLKVFLSACYEINEDILSWVTLLKPSRWKIFFLVVFPYCYRNLFTGLKIAITYSVSTALVVELLGSEKGLGISISRALSSYHINVLFAIVLLVVLMSVFLYSIALWLELKALPWKKNRRVFFLKKLK